jgi:hypothetical protein
MMGNRRPAVFTLCAALVALVALAWPIGAWGASADDNPDAHEAARLVRRARDAADQHDFTGTAVIRWMGGKGPRRARVRVRDAAGAVEIISDDGTDIIDQGRRTYLREHLGWTGALIEPAAGPLPDPDRHWRLATGASRRVAGRPATVVVASRAGGTPAQRLFVDDATGLVLAREVLGPDGRVQRSVRFVSVDIGAPATAVTAPKGVHSRNAEELSSVPDGYHAPRSVDGYELVTRSRHPDGVLLFYSDGLFTASVFEQKGELDWDALPGGGTDTRVADTRSRRYREPSADVLVWERDGVVYTCVSDAPSDVGMAMADDLAAADRSTPESVVDFVLGPFGWN